MAEPAAVDPGPGVLLGGGRYVLDQLIGSGGMATVWRATDRRLGRSVAVKLISEALADDPTYAERFAREARTAAGLSHANLVQVYDYGADEHRPFLVMEYVDGGTLAERIERGPVVGEEAAAVAADLLSALECIHRAGILHRDVKPANVLLSSDGRARITDFGIAHPEDSTRLTQTGHLVGTLRYLAPEVIDGEPASCRSDLYALGVLLRDLAGEDPDPTTEELVNRLTERVPARRPRSAAHARGLLGRPPAGASATAAIPVSPAAPAAREVRTGRAAPAIQPNPATPATPAGRADRARRAGRPAPASPSGQRTPASPAQPAAVERRQPRLPPAAPPPRQLVSVPRPGRRPPRTPAAPSRARRPVRRLRRTVAAAVCLLVAVVVVVAANGNGNGGSTAKRAVAVPVKTGLTGRLDELERLVRAAGQP